jgi:hypothetical protein
MNHARLPKEVLLPDWARQDKQGTKGDRVYPCIPHLLDLTHTLQIYEN